LGVEFGGKRIAQIPISSKTPIGYSCLVSIERRSDMKNAVRCLFALLAVMLLASGIPSQGQTKAKPAVKTAPAVKALGSISKM
jgi:hypothetical protein